MLRDLRHGVRVLIKETGILADRSHDPCTWHQGKYRDLQRGLYCVVTSAAFP
jgi:hypothetical protein